MVEENESMKKTLAQVKDNIELIHEKEKEVSALKVQIDQMRKEALVSEKIRKKQDTDTTLTDYYNDVLNEHLLHVESSNCMLRQQVQHLQAERRRVKKQLVKTDERNQYFAKRLKIMETQERNFLLNSKRGSRTLEYKSTAILTNDRTSTGSNNEMNDIKQSEKKLYSM